MLLYGADNNWEKRLAQMIPANRLGPALEEQCRVYLGALRTWFQNVSASDDVRLLGWQGLGYLTRDRPGRGQR
jgi:ribosomal protein L13